MNLTHEELDALAERLWRAWHGSPPGADAFLPAAREAARWAEEQQGEVVWEYQTERGWWAMTCSPEDWKSLGYPVRAIRVIATTTKGVG